MPKNMPFMTTLEQGTIIGELADNRQRNHFAMVRIKEAAKNHWSSRWKQHERRRYAPVSGQKQHPIAMGRMHALIDLRLPLFKNYLLFKKRRQQLCLKN